MAESDGPTQVFRRDTLCLRTHARNVRLKEMCRSSYIYAVTPTSAEAASHRAVLECRFCLRTTNGISPSQIFFITAISAGVHLLLPPAYSLTLPNRAWSVTFLQRLTPTCFPSKIRDFDSLPLWDLYPRLLVPGNIFTEYALRAVASSHPFPGNITVGPVF
jgi:hypothetical protein